MVYPHLLDEAKLLFKDIQINIVTGHMFLRGCVNNAADCHNWVRKNRSLDTFSSCTIKSCRFSASSFVCCIHTIVTSRKDFLEKIIAVNEASLLCRSSNFGGQGISDPVQTAHLFSNATNSLSYDKNYGAVILVLF